MWSPDRCIKRIGHGGRAENENACIPVLGKWLRDHVIVGYCMHLEIAVSQNFF